MALAQQQRKIGNERREALSLIDSEKPDIMLLDIIMPGMDGFEVLSRVRSFSLLPIIVISAKDFSVAYVRNQGADDYIAKPFRMEDLIRKINALLKAKGQRPQYN